MAEVFLPAVNPVDESSPHYYSGEPPLGGLMGDGDLTSDDGDATGWEGWATVSAAVAGANGHDQFSYDIALSGLPAGATITGYRFEMTARLLAESSPQTYSEPFVSGNWSTSGGHYFWKIWAAGEDYFNYNTYVSETRPPPADFLAEVAAGTARLTYTVDDRSAFTDGPSPVRVTMGGIRVYYTEPAPTETPGFIATRRRRGAIRQLQRGDARGMSTAPRALQHNSTQGSLRNIGFD